MDLALLRSDIQREESCRLLAYQDTQGVFTIGWGHTGPEVHAGLVWGQDMADQTLDLDIEKVVSQLDEMLPWWRTLDDVRANVLAQMAYQLGIGGLLEFKQMLAHVKAGEWDLAKAAGLDSLWAKQTPDRAKREMDQLESGVHS